MSRRERRRRVVVVLMGATLAIALLTACDDTEAVSDYMDSWLDSQSADQQAANGSGHTGDDGVDGILEAAETVNDIAEADEIYARARPLVDSHDTEQAAPLLDQAIALRPDDIRYRRDRARIALLADDPVIARQQWEEVDRIAREQGYADADWYLEGVFRDALQGYTDLLTSHPSATSFTSAQDRRAVVIYERMAEILERAAAQNVLVGQFGDAAAQLQEAEENRAAAKRHGG